jgi:hypothetical protein
MFSKVELLALIKSYNKNHTDKIKNADKMNKAEIIEVCRNYAILPDHTSECTCIEVDLRSVKKYNLLQDVEMYFLKQDKCVPTNVLHMKKADLIAYMELNDIQHYTQELLENEVKMYRTQKLLKNIVVLNIIKYDNIDVTQIPASDNIEELETFVKALDADDLDNLAAYSAMLKNIYDAYDTFCKATGKIATPDKIKSFPKILNKLQNILQ